MELQERLQKIHRLENGMEAKAVEARGRESIVAAVKRRIHLRLIEEMTGALAKKGVSDAELRIRVSKEASRILTDDETPITTEEKRRIIADIIDDVVGYGPIECFLEDPEVTEIMVNGPYTIYVEKDGKIYPTDKAFLDEVHLMRIIDKIVARVGRRVDESVPMVDARLPDGSRVNVIIPPLALGGPVLTVRKFSHNPFTIQDLVEMGTLTQKAANFLNACVRGRLDILTSGGTGTGKTTTLNVLSSFIPGDQRIITIEDAAELQFHQRHVIRLESRPPNIEGKGEVSIRDLVRNALRMRPDRIIVGEVRGGEALDMLQAMNTGHDGSLSTVHANSPRDVLSRLETMVLMAGLDLPVRAIREQISSAIDLIVHLNRLKDGTRRVVSVTEVLGMEGDVITLQDLFLFDFAMGMDSTGRYRGRLKSTGLRPHFMEKLRNYGIDISPEVFEREI
ncbi:pilus assembly protein CpaF [Candidatus Hakubella thermalkaliphila]|uniref:Pilus assembly protein CpaF n=1 Tax=Candidatus Hakubella thermalkaliphila TaxID=2754717 RepID=A0A6V8PIZ2_9ACTN|nr:pilus assembly protein CpaF [Candidatus Hakubella thermalkaliphila]